MKIVGNFQMPLLLIQKVKNMNIANFVVIILVMIVK